MSPKLAEKLERCRDLRELRQSYSDFLSDPDDHYKHRYFSKMRAYCQSKHGQTEVWRSLSEVERLRKKEVTRA